MADAAHYPANFAQNGPFPIWASAADLLEGFASIGRMLASPGHFMPGLDQLVLKGFPIAFASIDDIVRLDADPVAER